MGQRPSLLWITLVSVIVLSGCEDGIKFPWSKDKPHEAEVTSDSIDVAIDSTGGQDISDSIVIGRDDSLAQKEKASEKRIYAGSGNAKQWRVVVSSMPSQALADKFIARHGLSQARVLYVAKPDTYRVVYESFPALSDAQVEFGIIKSDFPEAWLVYF